MWLTLETRPKELTVLGETKGVYCCDYRDSNIRE